MIKIIFGVIVNKDFDIMISFKLLTKAIVQLESDEIAQCWYLIENEYLMWYTVISWELDYYYQITIEKIELYRYSENTIHKQF